MTVPEGLRCPKCGSMDIAEILYGSPEMTAELIQKIQLRRVTVRPDRPAENAPMYYCNYCQYEW